jgi:CBS domain-containing protein
MRVLDPISLILSKKGCDVWSIPSDATVYSAMQAMADHDVGALLVIDDGQLVGLISERDYARKVVLLDRGSKETLVSEIMVASPITIGPQCSVEEAMWLMTTNRIRHLPVVCDGRICGMISIGDLVHWIAFAQDHVIEELENYIGGRYFC